MQEISSEKIVEALSQMDPLDDDQWTFEGAPKIETVTSLLGHTVRRQDIVNAAPDFNREKAAANAPQTEPEEAPEPEEEAPEPEEEAESEKGETVVMPTEAEFVTWLKRVPVDQLETVEQDLKSQLDSISSEIEEKRALMLRIKRGINITRLHIRSAHPNTSDRDATRQFIKAQTEARAARINRRNSILQGIRPEELDPRAPIDSAMARKTKRGGQRPARPLMK